MTIGCGACDMLGCDGAGGTDTIFNDEILLEGALQTLGRQPRHDVGDSAGGKTARPKPPTAPARRPEQPAKRR